MDLARYPLSHHVNPEHQPEMPADRCNGYISRQQTTIILNGDVILYLLSSGSLTCRLVESRLWQAWQSGFWAIRDTRRKARRPLNWKASTSPPTISTRPPPARSRATAPPARPRPPKPTLPSRISRSRSASYLPQCSRTLAATMSSARWILPAAYRSRITSAG